jgi:hypothetical protein
MAARMHEKHLQVSFRTSEQKKARTLFLHTSTTRHNRRLRFTYNVQGSFVISQGNESRVAQMIVGCPLGKLELPNQDRLLPNAFFHFFGGEALPPPTAFRLGQVGKGHRAIQCPLHSPIYRSKKPTDSALCSAPVAHCRSRPLQEMLPAELHDEPSPWVHRNATLMLDA